ncbi:MAG: M23 family metallopeptidase [Anaerolineales bacterium]|nr:M23 family metallopeptidase [Anaerolineales bacterium]
MMASIQPSWGPNRRQILVLGLALGSLALVGGYLFFKHIRPNSERLTRLRSFWRNPMGHPEWTVEAGQRCPGAPFLIPTEGMIGFLWGDSFRPGHVHQGIDIFAPTGPEGLGETPVVAAYDGYITREADWRSALIQRVPKDPLQPERQIWLYYTHMADPQGNSFIVDEFPAGAEEKFVTAGTLLGYQGNYSGNPDNPTGIHLHFSIVKDDGQGNFLNELEFDNTVDPSAYLGLELNAEQAGDQIPLCPEPA